MPGVSRFGINQLKTFLAPLIRKGLSSVLLFGVVENTAKVSWNQITIHTNKLAKLINLQNSTATSADSVDNPVVKALPKLREWFPDLVIACDVCLCPYSDHGHCGILGSDNDIDNEASIRRIAQVALAYAKAGLSFADCQFS